MKHGKSVSNITPILKLQVISHKGYFTLIMA